ncbi:MAG TPA: hypothetical protein VHR18_12185 [Solirubrobacterales bacterium]|jgi:hypothetical protein|nr:hypothetical protein [Solirubrobacterales bacterium]
MCTVLLVAGQAQAASFPSGGSTFSGGAEGWKPAQPPACNIGLGGLCTATAGYDGANGNPSGSLAATTTVVVNAGGLFKSTAAFESPNFVATEGGPATLSLDRQLASGSLLDLTPQLKYTVTLVDRTGGDSTDVLTETVTGAAETFAGKESATKLVAGHTYAILIDSETSSSVANVGLLGSASARFDNVSVTVGSSGGGGGNGGGAGGGNGLSNASLTTLMQNSLIGPAVLKGKRLFVRAKCPAKVGRACKVTVQGLLKKGKPATTKRTAKIAKGKTKQLVLRVKPKLRPQVAAKKKLLFKQTVKAGKAKATVYKRLKLIKR